MQRNDCVSCFVPIHDDHEYKLTIIWLSLWPWHHSHATPNIRCPIMLLYTLVLNTIEGNVAVAVAVAVAITVTVTVSLTSIVSAIFIMFRYFPIGRKSEIYRKQSIRRF